MRAEKYGAGLCGSYPYYPWGELVYGAVALSFPLEIRPVIPGSGEEGPELLKPIPGIFQAVQSFVFALLWH